MNIHETLLSEAKAILDANREMLAIDESIVSIGCWACGLGCTDTVGG